MSSNLSHLTMYKPDDLFAEVLFDMLVQFFQADTQGRQEFVDGVLSAAGEGRTFYWWCGPNDVAWGNQACVFTFDTDNGPCLTPPVLKSAEANLQYGVFKTQVQAVNDVFKRFWTLEDK